MSASSPMDFLRGIAEANQSALLHASGPQQLGAVVRAGRLIVDVFGNGGVLASAGNGGSMADAMHLAEELSGRYRSDRPALRAIALSDPTFLTCVGNDFGFSEVFSRGCEAVLRPGDVAVLYSTSGMSENILRAASYCRSNEISSIGVTGVPESKLGGLVDVHLAPSTPLPTEHAQLVHTMWTHMLIELVEKQMGYA